MTPTPPSSRRVAFLRAINVGGHTVKMDRLRALFGEMGFGGVETFIASGNVVFDAPDGGDDAALERRIERHLRAALGYEVATFVRTLAEVGAVAEHEPFPSDSDGKLHVAFLPAPPDAEAAARLLALRADTDDLHLHGRELYWLRRVGVNESAVSGAGLERAAGTPTTVRNVNTVRRIAAKYGR